MYIFHALFDFMKFYIQSCHLRSEIKTQSRNQNKKVMAPKKRFDTPFTTEQEVWIVKQFHCGLSPIEVKRAFRKEHGLSRKIMNVQPRQFKRVF